MKDKFIRLTSGWIPVSVMLLLATALVYGGNAADPAADRVRDGLPAEFPLFMHSVLPAKPGLFELRISPLHE